MALESTSKLVIPGTILHALLQRNKGKQMDVMTTAGMANGLLHAFNPTFLTLTSDTGKETYILFDYVVSFSFTEPDPSS
ncbi:hypothetical protein ACFPYJ_19780 [Paenibacillus solisilvae]|uniref:DUF2642 domain-containing protein n=1 Tax=Paenibacillus solisilvae TaxID=2486751 RepID=A0ABW0W0U4_9BACL